MKPYVRYFTLACIFVSSFFSDRFVHYRARGDGTVPVLPEAVVDGSTGRAGILPTTGSSNGSVTRQKARIKKITRQIPSDLPHTVGPEL